MKNFTITLNINKDISTMTNTARKVPTPYIPEDFEGMKIKFPPGYHSYNFPECDDFPDNEDLYPVCLELRLEVAEYFEER